MIRVLALKKTRTHHVYQFEKGKDILGALRQILQTLGFEKHQTTEILAPLGDVDNNFSARSYSSKLYEDRYFSLANAEFAVDIFFGRNRAVLSVFGFGIPVPRLLTNAFKIDG